MNNDEYNPEKIELNKKSNAEPDEIDPAWASVATEATPDPDWSTLEEEANQPAPESINSPEFSERTHTGTIGEDLDILRNYLDGVNDENADSLENISMRWRLNSIRPATCQMTDSAVKKDRLGGQI